MEIFNNLTVIHKALIGVSLLVVVYFAYGWYQRRSQQRQMIAQSKEHYAGGGGGGGTGGELVCTMYHVDWCKFCKQAKPEWQKLASDFNGKVINGKKITILDVNCDENEEVAEKEGIKSYPTLKFTMNGKPVEYPDEPTYDKLKNFIEYLVSQ